MDKLWHLEIDLFRERIVYHDVEMMEVLKRLPYLMKLKETQLA